MVTLSVPDMSCAHCKASVEQALGAQVPASGVTVDLAARTVQVTADADPQILIKLLDRIGFPAQVVVG